MHAWKVRSTHLTWATTRSPWWDTRCWLPTWYACWVSLRSFDDEQYEHLTSTWVQTYACTTCTIINIRVTYYSRAISWLPCKIFQSCLGVVSLHPSFIRARKPNDAKYQAVRTDSAGIMPSPNIFWRVPGSTGVPLRGCGNALWLREM